MTCHRLTRVGGPRRCFIMDQHRERDIVKPCPTQLSSGSRTVVNAALITTPPGAMMKINQMSSLLMVWASCGSPAFKSMYPPGGVRRVFPLPGRDAKIACRVPEDRPLTVWLIASQLFLAHLMLPSPEYQCSPSSMPWYKDTSWHFSYDACCLFLWAHVIPGNAGQDMR